MPNQTDFPKRCLLVEDDALLVDAFKMVLEDAGASQVEQVDTEADAIAAILRERPDVALLDVDITGGTSLGVATALLAKDVPVAFISGHVVTDLPRPFSAMPFLQKPVSRRELLALVGALERAGNDGSVVDTTEIRPAV